MKAILRRRYGPPELLTCEETAKPEPGDGEALVAVKAASVNPLDWHFMRGEPYFMRLMLGLPAPKNPRLGMDVAGIVEAVGRNVTRLKPGDEVLGACEAAVGSFAEFACVAEASLVKKPANVTFEQAGCVCAAGITALQALRKGGVAAGTKVVVNGAAGGVGTFAVQMAKTVGAQVTGVCSTRNVEMVRSIGADAAIDYTREDFTRRSGRWDVMIDCIGNRSIADWRRVLARDGICVIVGAKTGRWLAPLPAMLATLAIAPFVSQRLAPMFARGNPADYEAMARFLASGQVRPVIDRHYALGDSAEAIRYLEQGHARGKVVITV